MKEDIISGKLKLNFDIEVSKKRLFLIERTRERKRENRRG